MTLLYAFILCTLCERSIENGDRSVPKRVRSPRGGARGFLNDADVNSLLCLSSTKGRHIWKRRGGGRISVGVQLRLYPVSCAYILKQGGRLYRRGNNATGVPERFHYTASRGIISRDISPRSTPRGWNSVPPTRLAWEMNPLYEVEHHPEQPPLEGERVCGKQGRKLPATGRTGARDRHAATENGRWPGCDRKYEGVILIMQRERVSHCLASVSPSWIWKSDVQWTQRVIFRVIFLLQFRFFFVSEWNI